MDVCVHQYKGMTSTYVIGVIPHKSDIRCQPYTTYIPSPLLDPLNLDTINLFVLYYLTSPVTPSIQSKHHTNRDGGFTSEQVVWSQANAS